MSKNISMVILTVTANFGDIVGSITTCFDESVTLDKLLDFKQELLKTILESDSSKLIDLIYDHNSIVTGLGNLSTTESMSITSDVEIKDVEEIVRDIIDYVFPHNEDITILTAKVNDNINHI